MPLNIPMRRMQMPKGSKPPVRLMGFDYGEHLFHLLAFDFGDDGGAVGVWREGDNFCARISLDALAEFWNTAKDADGVKGKAEAKAEQPRDVPPGKWQVDMPDGQYLHMPGDPPGPGDLRRVIDGYVYYVEPRTGRLIADEPPTGYRLQVFNEDMQRRAADVVVDRHQTISPADADGAGK